MSAYTLTIKLIDSLLVKILNKLDTEQYKKEDTLLILSSDHWAPQRSVKFKSREMDPKHSAFKHRKTGNPIFRSGRGRFPSLHHFFLADTILKP